MKKKLLIIGSTGFFGKSILDYLDKIKEYDKSFSHIYLLSKTKKNILSNNLKRKFRFIQLRGDLSKIKKIPTADYIIYCSLSKNLGEDKLAVKNYVKLAKKFHLGSKIIYMSSGAVYGKQPKKIKKIKENYPIHQLKIKDKYKERYAKVKRINELELSALRQFGINLIIARCFSFVGKNIPFKKYVAGNLIKNVIEKRKLIINSNYRVTRSYLHTDYLSKFLIKILINEKKKISIYNIGSDDSIDIHFLAKKLAIKYRIKFQFKKFINKSKIDLYVPSINKFRLNYKFNIKLDSFKSICKTIDELRN